MITGHRSSFARIWRALHSMRTMTVSRKFQNYPIQLRSLRSSFQTKFSIPLLSPWSFQIFHPQLLKHWLLLIQSIVHRLLPLALLPVTLIGSHTFHTRKSQFSRIFGLFSYFLYFSHASYDTN